MQFESDHTHETGLHAVFYPVGETWADSPVIMYAKAVGKSDSDATVKAFVEATIKDFKDAGSIKVKAEKKDSIKIDEDRAAEIWFYTGDQWGNYEAAAYIDEESTINFFIMTTAVE